MTLAVAIQMDPIEAVNIETETAPSMLMMEAQETVGIRCWVIYAG